MGIESDPAKQERLDIADLQRLYRTFEGESDRGAAIVGAAYLESSVAGLLAAFFIEDATRPDGELRKWPLDSYAKTATVAHWSGLISDDERHDLGVIRSIRNRFAHEGQPVCFSDPDVVGQCATLRLWKPLAELLPLDTPRSQFLFTVTTLLMQLGMRSLRAKRERRVKPSQSKISQIVR